MPRVTVDRHVFANVASGLDPRRGQGFQTVMAGESLLRTEDLAVLEQVAFYAASPERRASANLPVKTTFLRLPSGRYAVGRIADIGPDPIGRPGNYAALHCIIDSTDLARLHGDPSGLLAKVVKPTAALLTKAGVIQPTTLDVAAVAPDFGALSVLPDDLLASLVCMVAEPAARPHLLIGSGEQVQALLAVLLHLVPLDRRLELTFCTHYYESDHLRPYFALMAVETSREAPSRVGDFHVISLEPGAAAAPPPALTTALGRHTLRCAMERSWQPILRLQALLASVQRGIGLPVGPDEAALVDVLWETAAMDVATNLLGEPECIANLVSAAQCGPDLATSLLAQGGPTHLLGRANQRTALMALRALHSAVEPSVWRTWARRHASDGLWQASEEIAALLPPRPWWRRLLRR